MLFEWVMVSTGVALSKTTSWLWGVGGGGCMYIMFTNYSLFSCERLLGAMSSFSTGTAEGAGCRHCPNRFVHAHRMLISGRRGCRLLTLSKQVRARTQNAGEWQCRVQTAVTVQTGSCMHTECW